MYPPLFWWAVGTLSHPVSASKILFVLRIHWFGLPLLGSVLVKGHLVSRSLAVFQMESTVIFSHWSSSSNSSVSSFQIVSRFFSPEMYMNLHSAEANLASSPWSSLHHLWWDAVWVSDEGALGLAFPCCVPNGVHRDIQTLEFFFELFC